MMVVKRSFNNLAGRSKLDVPDEAVDVALLVVVVVVATEVDLDLPEKFEMTRASLKEPFLTSGEVAMLEATLGA